MSSSPWPHTPHVLLVAGARPNFPKLKPVLDAVESAGCRTTFVHTGQHYDHALSGSFLDELGIRAPDHSLDVGSGPHGEQTAKIMIAFEPIVNDLRPDIVVVAGDVNSTVACSLVAAKAGCLVAHVEAGLRSRDWSMPEEVNRVVTDRLSDVLLAPSEDAVENLRSEGYRSDQIHLVGNVMIDTLLANMSRAEPRLDALLTTVGVERKQYALATLHRPSNVDDPETLGRLIDALGRLAEQLPVLLPAHPRASDRIGELARDRAAIHVLEPFSYLDFLALQSNARLVLTDSGGVQEETTALGVPCLTLRQNTERPVTVTHGTNQLVGTDTNRIVARAAEVIEHGVEPRRPELWDGRAGQRVAAALLDGGPADRRLRPTDRSPDG